MARTMRARALPATTTALAVSIAALSGCPEPEKAPSTRPTTQPAATQPERSSAETPLSTPAMVAPVPCDRPWEPGVGRLDTIVASRHALPSKLLRRSGVDGTLLWEDFTGARGGAIPGWRFEGNASAIIRAGDPKQGKWLQLRSRDRSEAAALVRQLPAEELIDSVVRVEVKMLFRGGPSAKKADLPEIRLEWADGGKSGSKRLPVHLYGSPGWERHAFTASIPATVKEVRLVITQQSVTSTVGLDDILVERVEPLQWARVPGTRESGLNLIVGGDFEVGQKYFSVYGARQVPGRNSLRACPLAWSIDDSMAAVGRRSLRVPLTEDEFRVAFGWVRIVPGKEYVVSMFARASTKMVIRVGLVVYPGLFRYDYFTVDEDFRRIALKVPLDQRIEWQAASVVVRPSDRPKDAHAKSPSSFLWLDGVSLTPGDPKTKYDPASPVEVGVVGPGFDSGEIAHLVQQGKPVEFSVRLKNYQTRAFKGQVAIDVVDAFDRPIEEAQQTLRVSVDPGEIAERKIGAVRLGRGYYRVLVSAWPEGVGQGRPYSTMERAFGVLNLTDPVPEDNYFGMTVESPRMSGRITQLGAGWIWLDVSDQWCQGLDGELHWSWYLDLVAKADAQNLEIVPDLAWSGSGKDAPSPGVPWRKVCSSFAEANKKAVATRGKTIDGIGILDEDALEDMTPEAYADLFEQAAAEMGRKLGKARLMVVLPKGPQAEQGAWLTQTSTASSLVRTAEGVAMRFPSTPFPEDIEPVLEGVRSWRRNHTFKRYLDVGVGGRAPSGYLHVPNLHGYHKDDADYGPVTPDPVLHASLLVRALAIRQYAMIDGAAWWVESHRPPDILRPTVDPQCHEYDNAPRHALVAFDFMAEMLNPAVLTEWIDLPQQARALCFERVDGEVIVLIWRPFGWSLYPVGLRGMAGKLRMYDLFGRRELHPTQGQNQVVLINAAVRYLRVPATLKAQALEALRNPVVLSAQGGAEAP